MMVTPERRDLRRAHEARGWTDRIPPVVALILLCASFAGACTRYVERSPGRRAYYQTQSPSFDVSALLEESLRSVKSIRASAVYESYVFTEAEAPTEDEDLTEDVLARAADTTRVDDLRRATAVAVGASGSRAVFLTVRHAVHFPDTVIQYFTGQADRPGLQDGPRRARAISFLVRTSGRVVDDGQFDYFEVLASDPDRDLALLGVEYPGDALPDDVEVLSVEPGDPTRLAWGSFVYVLGYPAGYPMVTRGIVSMPEGRAGYMRSFTMDGVWNRGMSGGPILAVRGDGQSLEWVGSARAAATELELRLVPMEDPEEEYEPGTPYSGPLRLEETPRILYGITLSIPIDEIRRFAGSNRDELGREGYEISLF